jgi:cyclopropane fatty-acyl-phospholipid synthase-like methyltransferase
MNYYNENGIEYIKNTINCDMSNLYNLFFKYINPKTKKILDIGFGSGRDMLYFKNKGYDVFGIDSEVSFCNYAKRMGLDNVECIKVQDIAYYHEFDAIWACASLLHVNKNELNEVFKKCDNALVNNGIMYCSFKYGDFEGIRNERYFIYLTEDSFTQYIKNTDFEILEIAITNDVREERKDERWLNVILKKVID